MICHLCCGSDSSAANPLNAAAIDSDLLQDIECTISLPQNPHCDSCMELANLENFIAKLEKKRSELKRNVNRTHSSFIRMVPTEIIAKISEFASTDFTIIGSLPAAILLSSVCSDWRRAVVGTPQLWSSIKIDLPSISKTSVMPVACSNTFLRLSTFIDRWLARSGQLPLHISLSSGHENPDPMALEKYRPIFNVLDRYSSRWHSLNISFTPTILSCLQSLADHLPLLEHIRVNVPFSMRNPGSVLTLPPSPRLKEVGFHAFIHSMLPPLSDMGIQWGNVTHVSAESLTMHRCFEFLRLVPQLVHCQFHNIIVGGSNRDSESLILSPALTYLSFSCYQMSPGSFFDKVSLPSLETLILFNASESSIDSLMVFLERSGCSLQALSLQQLNIKKVASLIRLLQFLSPSLTKLVISQVRRHFTNEEYLSILTKTYESQRAVANGFLPHLEFFGYNEPLSSGKLSVTEPFTLPNVLTAGNYSKPTITIPLRSAYIDVNSSVININFISQDLLSVLQYLKEDGILRTNPLDLFTTQILSVPFNRFASS